MPIGRTFPKRQKPTNPRCPLLSICMTTPFLSCHSAFDPKRASSAPHLRHAAPFQAPCLLRRERAGVGGCRAGRANLGCQPFGTIHSLGAGVVRILGVSHVWLSLSCRPSSLLPPLLSSLLPLPSPPSALPLPSSSQPIFLKSRDGRTLRRKLRLREGACL